jgi:hypothetical protein
MAPHPVESDIGTRAHAAFNAIAEAMRRVVVEASLLSTKSDAVLWAAAVAGWQAEVLGHQLKLVALEAETKIDSGKADARAMAIIRQAGPLLLLWRGWCNEALGAAADRVPKLPQEWAVGLRLIANIYRRARLQIQLGSIEAERAQIEKTLEWLRPLAARESEARRRRLKAEAEHQRAERVAEERIADARARRQRAESDTRRLKAETARIVEEDRKFRKRLKKARHKGRAWALQYDRLARAEAEGEVGVA